MCYVANVNSPEEMGRAKNNKINNMDERFIHSLVLIREIRYKSCKGL